MPRYKLRDLETGEIIYVDESELSAEPPTPALMPVPTPRPLTPEEQANQLTPNERAAAFAMAPFQGLTLNTIDEIIGKFSPETGEYLGDIYGKFQATDPMVAMGGELIGPGLGAKAMRGIGKIGVQGAETVAQAIEALQKGGPISQGIQGAISGAASTQGDVEDRIIGGGFGGVLGLGGGTLGSLAGKALGGGTKVLARPGAELSEAERVIAQNYANKAQAENFSRMTQEAGQDISAPMTFAEMGGKEAVLPAVANMTEGQFIQDILRGREAARPERLQSTMEQALGGQGQVPRQLQAEGAMMSRDVLGEAERRQGQAGRELYSPLEVGPELTGGQKVTMGEGVSGKKLAREEAKFGRTIGKAEVQIENILDDVADDFGEDVANSIMEPGISAEQRNARIKALGRRGYEDTDLLQDAFSQVDEAQLGIVAKNRLRKEVATLTEPLSRRDWRTLLNHIYVGEKTVPKLSDIPLDELKIRILGTVKTLNREAKARGQSKILDKIDATAMQRLERSLDQGFARIFPGIKEADYTFATKTIPEAFGGMEEMARDALRRMGTFDPKKPADINKMGKIIGELDPMDVSQIVSGSEKIGRPEMREAMKKGYVGMLKKQIQTRPNRTMKFFEGNSNQKQILEILAGPKEATRALRSLKRERNMAIVEQKALRGSPTAPSKMAQEELGEQVQGSRTRNIFQRATNVFRSAPAALDALVEMAPELKDTRLKNEILRIYSLQGVSAYRKMQQLEPVIRKMEKLENFSERLTRIGVRVGAKAAERKGMSEMEFTTSKQKRK